MLEAEYSSHETYAQHLMGLAHALKWNKKNRNTKKGTTNNNTNSSSYPINVISTNSNKIMIWQIVISEHINPNSPCPQTAAHRNTNQNRWPPNRTAVWCRTLNIGPSSGIESGHLKTKRDAPRKLTHPIRNASERACAVLLVCGGRWSFVSVVVVVYGSHTDGRHLMRSRPANQRDNTIDLSVAVQPTPELLMRDI